MGNTKSAEVTLWRPVGPKELDLIRQSGMRAFLPRLPQQPAFSGQRPDYRKTGLSRSYSGQREQERRCGNYITMVE